MWRQAVEPVIDSSRYFCLRIVDTTGQSPKERRYTIFRPNGFRFVPGFSNARLRYDARGLDLDLWIVLLPARVPDFPGLGPLDCIAPGTSA